MSNIVTDIAVVKNWDVGVGFDNPFTITCTQSAVAFNTSTYVFSAQIRQWGNPSNFISLTEGSGVTNGGASGIITISLTAAQSALLTSGEYFYQVTVVHPDGKTYRWLKGNISAQIQELDGGTVSGLTATISISGSDVDLAITIAGGSGAFEDLTGSPSDNAALAAALALKANLASPALTGTPTAPLAAAGTNTTQLATTSFVQQELNTGLTTVSITGATVLDDTAFGKVHLCTGTSAGYNVTAPTPSAANQGKTFIIKGGTTAALTVDVTIVATLSNEANNAVIGAEGYLFLESLGLNNGYRWHVYISGWVTWTTNATGYSSLPTIVGEYSRVGMNCTIRSNDSATGTSNATTKTRTLPYKANNAFTCGFILYTDNGVASATLGLIQTRANSNIADLYSNTAFAGFTASGSHSIRRIFPPITYRIDPT